MAPESGQRPPIFDEMLPFSSDPELMPHLRLGAQRGHGSHGGLGRVGKTGEPHGTKITGQEQKKRIVEHRHLLPQPSTTEGPAPKAQRKMPALSEFEKVDYKGVLAKRPLEAAHQPRASCTCGLQNTQRFQNAAWFLCTPGKEGAGGSIRPRGRFQNTVYSQNTACLLCSSSAFKRLLLSRDLLHCIDYEGVLAKRPLSPVLNSRDC